MGVAYKYQGVQDGRHAFYAWDLTSKTLQDIIDWCNEHVGLYGEHWESSTARHGPTWGAIYIRDDAPAFAFRMRWC